MEPKTFSCEICKKEYARRSKLTAHLSRSHLDKKTYKCTKCSKAFALKNVLQRHQTTHLTDKPFRCDFCDRGFKCKYIYTRHILSHTKEKHGKCSVCSKRFTESGLHKHMKRVHGNEVNYRFECIFCGKNYDAASQFNGHLRQHNRERPHFCSVCGYEAGSGGDLRKHVEIHKTKRKRTFQCEHCPRCFFDKHALGHHIKYVHLRIHENLHKCELCGKGFQKSAALKLHLTTHSNERKFHCNFCRKDFTSKGGLTRHKLVHTGRKSFCCYICSKWFLFKDYLLNHVRTHIKDRPFKCDQCGASFKQQTGLGNHKRKKHN